MLSSSATKTKETKTLSSKLYEGLSYKDLEGVLKPTVHIDEFSSKMGGDDEIVVVSFFVRNQQAAEDLVNWFEKGYDFVLDADMSPGEIKPNRYLVYLELKRRSTTAARIDELLDDLNTITEHEVNHWMCTYKDEEFPWSIEAYHERVPSSPKEYRADTEDDLNEMRVASGIQPKKVYESDPYLKQLQNAAGINLSK